MAHLLDLKGPPLAGTEMLHTNSPNHDNSTALHPQNTVRQD